MSYTENLLTSGEVAFEKFDRSAVDGVFLTAGNQLVGTYKSLCRYRDSDDDYHGWQAHHVVETHDLKRLHVEASSPRRDDQVCVLLPERAHIGRINSILRSRVPIGSSVPPRELISAYHEAYALIDDYCGGGARLIQRELVNIVRATFRRLSLV